MPSEVRTRKGEPVERALRRLKKKMDKEGTMKELRNRRHFDKAIACDTRVADPR